MIHKWPLKPKNVCLTHDLPIITNFVTVIKRTKVRTNNKIIFKFHDYLRTFKATESRKQEGHRKLHFQMLKICKQVIGKASV